MKGEIMFGWGKALIVMSRIFIIICLAVAIVVFIWIFK